MNSKNSIKESSILSVRLLLLSNTEKFIDVFLDYIFSKSLRMMRLNNSEDILRVVKSQFNIPLSSSTNDKYILVLVSGLENLFRKVDPKDFRLRDLEHKFALVDEQLQKNIESMLVFGGFDYSIKLEEFILFSAREGGIIKRRPFSKNEHKTKTTNIFMSSFRHFLVNAASPKTYLKLSELQNILNVLCNDKHSTYLGLELIVSDSTSKNAYSLDADYLVFSNKKIVEVLVNNIKNITVKPLVKLVFSKNIIPSKILSVYISDSLLAIAVFKYKLTDINKYSVSENNNETRHLYKKLADYFIKYYCHDIKISSRASKDFTVNNTRLFRKAKSEFLDSISSEKFELLGKVLFKSFQSMGLISIKTDFINNKTIVSDVSFNISNFVLKKPQENYIADNYEGTYESIDFINTLDIFKILPVWSNYFKNIYNNNLIKDKEYNSNQAKIFDEHSDITQEMFNIPKFSINKSLVSDFIGFNPSGSIYKYLDEEQYNSEIIKDLQESFEKMSKYKNVEHFSSTNKAVEKFIESKSKVFTDIRNLYLFIQFCNYHYSFASIVNEKGIYFSPIIMDWRGRRYFSKASCSFSGNKLSRLLVGNTDKVTDKVLYVKYLFVYLNDKLLKEKETQKLIILKSKHPYIEDIVTKVLNLLLSMVLVPSFKPSFYRDKKIRNIVTSLKIEDKILIASIQKCLSDYSIYTSVDLYNNEECLERLCNYTIELDHTSSGPQIMSLILGDKASQEKTITSLNEKQEFRFSDIYKEIIEEINSTSSELTINISRKIIKEYVMPRIYGSLSFFASYKKINKYYKMPYLKLTSTEAFTNKLNHIKDITNIVNKAEKKVIGSLSTYHETAKIIAEQTIVREKKIKWKLGSCEVTQYYHKNHPTVIRKKYMGSRLNFLVTSNQPDLKKNANAFGPNFLHSCDAFLLYNVLLKLNTEYGKNLQKYQCITIHDAYIVRPCDIFILNDVINKVYAENIIVCAKELNKLINKSNIAGPITIVPISSKDHYNIIKDKTKIVTLIAE